MNLIKNVIKITNGKNKEEMLWHYVPGAYEGIGRGYRGKLIVNVTVTEERVEKIQIVKHKEVRGLAWDLPTSPIESSPSTDYRIPVAEYSTGKWCGSDQRGHTGRGCGRSQSSRATDEGHRTTKTSAGA